MWILDAHLDLSMNAMEWNRDLTRSVAEIRDREQGQTDKPDRGQGTVALPDMRRGRIGICVATQIARYVKPSNNLQGCILLNKLGPRRRGNCLGTARWRNEVSSYRSQTRKH